MPGTERRRWLYPYGLLLVILLAALGARTYKLGTYSFWTDEMYHVVAARSLLETGTPYVPGYTEGQYLRAYPVTYLAAVAFDWFGDNEAAARAAFVLINMAFLVVAFYVVRRWFNIHLALIVVFVLAFSPHELVLGREVRMYSLLQLLYFSVAAIVFQVVESGALWPFRLRRALWLAAAGVLFLLSAWTQLLTLNVAITLAFYSLVMAVRSGFGGGLSALVRSRYFVLLMLIAAAVLAVRLVAPSFLDLLVTVATERPPWAGTKHPFHFYSWYFQNYYPALTFVYLLGALLLIRHYGRPGAFVVISFVPLMCAHLFLFTGRVEERYISYLLPYFIIAACYPIQLALQSILRFIGSEWRAGSKVVAVSACLAALPVPSLFAHTWLQESWSMLRWGYGPNWKTVAPTLRELASECVVMSPWALHVAYYSGEFPDYILRKKQPEDGEGPIGRLGSRSVPVRWMYDAGEFERIVAQNDVCVIMTEWAYNNDAYIDASMRAAIDRLLVKTNHPGDEEVLIYRKVK